MHSFRRYGWTKDGDTGLLGRSATVTVRGEVLGGGDHRPPAMGDDMRRLIVFFMLAVFLGLAVSSSALAAGLGISPPTVEFDVPADGSATVEFLVYDFTGDLEISLEDIPLRVEPTTVSVSAKVEGTRVVLTFYGDDSLGSQVFNGKIRFLAVTGGTVAMGIKVRATVTNLVEGETPVLATPEGSQPPVSQEPTEEAPTPPAPPAPSSTTELPILLLAGIAAGTIIVITLIVVVARRPRY